MSPSHFLRVPTLFVYHILSLNTPSYPLYSSHSYLLLSLSIILSLDHILSILSHSFLSPSLSTFLVCLLSLPIILTIILSQNSSFTLCHDLSIIPIYPPLNFTFSYMNNQNSLPHHSINRNLPGWHPNPAISETLYIRGVNSIWLQPNKNIGTQSHNRLNLILGITQFLRLLGKSRG